MKSGECSIEAAAEFLYLLRSGASTRESFRIWSIGRFDFDTFEQYVEEHYAAADRLLCEREERRRHNQEIANLICRVLDAGGEVSDDDVVFFQGLPGEEQDSVRECIEGVVV